MSYNNESSVDSLNQTVPLYSLNSSFIDEVPIDIRDTSDRQDSVQNKYLSSEVRRLRQRLAEMERKEKERQN
ncbi:MAG: hypothetical protein EZS28_040789, partial [Streblomastix strix]